MFVNLLFSEICLTSTFPSCKHKSSLADECLVGFFIPSIIYFSELRLFLIITILSTFYRGSKGADKNLMLIITLNLALLLSVTIPPVNKGQIFFQI